MIPTPQNWRGTGTSLSPGTHPAIPLPWGQPKEMPKLGWCPPPLLGAQDMPSLKLSSVLGPGIWSRGKASFMCKALCLILSTTGEYPTPSTAKNDHSQKSIKIKY